MKPLNAALGVLLYAGATMAAGLGGDTYLTGQIWTPLGQGGQGYQFQIVLDGTTLVAETDSAGWFTFQDLTPGAYMIEAVEFAPVSASAGIAASVMPHQITPQVSHGVVCTGYPGSYMMAGRYLLSHPDAADPWYIGARIVPDECSVLFKGWRSELLDKGVIKAAGEFGDMAGKTVHVFVCNTLFGPVVLDNKGKGESADKAVRVKAAKGTITVKVKNYSGALAYAMVQPYYVYGPREYVPTVSGIKKASWKKWNKASGLVRKMGFKQESNVYEDDGYETAEFGVNDKGMCGPYTFDKADKMGGSFKSGDAKGKLDVKKSSVSYSIKNGQCASPVTVFVQ